MELIREAEPCVTQMAIIEKYERVVMYLYPIAQSIPRRHGIVRDRFLDCLLGVPDLFYQAGKSRQISRLYHADAALAHLRFWLRLLHRLHVLTDHQQQTALLLVAEVGGMTNAWISGWQRQQKGRGG